MLGPQSKRFELGMFNHRPVLVSLLFVFGLFGAFFVSPLFAEEAAAKKVVKTPDVRVLVDISGSMKKNDPDNLRVPAIKLLANLMPSGSEAGVWTFAKFSNMLIPHDPVDGKWKQMATTEANKINSVGLFTNIALVLEKALATWTKPDETKERSLILLTDGMVDISKDPAVNKQSRDRILNELLPQLKAVNVRVHTIALSDNADKDLLQTMSVKTDGIFAIAHNSDELLKVFLQAFDQSVEQDEVPLEGNRFSIDSSVEEFTALVFRVPGSPATQLTMPGGQVLSLDSQLDGLNWFHDNYYDLITVRNPAAGEWGLVADLDPSNRVTVVSDLELNLSGLPNNIVKGEQLVLTISLSDQGETVVRPEFLSLIDLTFRQEYVGQDKMWEGKLTSNKQGKIRTPKDGKYSAKLSKTLMPGEHEFSVVLDGKTFQRKRKHHLTVHGSLVEALTVEQTGEQGSEYFLNIVPVANMVNTETVKVYAEINTPNENVIQAIPEVTEFGSWKLDVPPSDGIGLYRVFLRVEGETIEGKAVNLTQAPVLVVYEEGQLQEGNVGETEIGVAFGEEQLTNQDHIDEEEIEEEVEEEPIEEEDEEEYEEEEEYVEEEEDEEEFEEEAAEDEEEEVTEEEEEPVDDESMKKMILWGSIALANLLIFGLGFYLYRRKVKKNEAEEKAVEARMNRSLEKTREVAKESAAEEEAEEAAETAAATLSNEGMDEPTHVDGVDLESDLSDDDGEAATSIAPPEIESNEEDDVDEMSLATDIEELTDLGDDDDDLDSSLDLSDTSDLDDEE